MEHMPKGSQAHVIAHREELINQAAEKIAFWNPKLNIGIEMGKSKADSRDDVVVSSIQTIISQERLHKFDPNNVAWLVVDEAHHATASTYVDVINYFLTSANTTLVGFTATPNRADGVALASVFDEVVFHYGMLEGIQDGYLSDVHGFTLKTGVDISGVRASKNDEGESGFNQKQLVSLINTPHRNEMIVKAWIDSMWPRQTIAFTEDIQHAKYLAAAFRRQGVKAEAVWGKSTKHGDSNRKAKIIAFESGEIQVLVNAQLLTEGFDVWQIEGIIIAAPTKSQAKFIQMVGRGTRLHFGIDNLIVWRNDGR
jgi:ATP-dependent helicase IRC3